MHITKVGYQYAVWNGSDLVGVYDSALEAQDAATGWDRKLWPWESLYDVENRKKLAKFAEINIYA